MSDLYHVSSAPHVRAKDTTSRIMLYVIIAMLPAAAFGIFNFGLRALLLIAATVASCVASEWVYNKIVHKEQTVGDLSAVVTGMILALNLPVNLPVWEAILGGVFAIVIVKCLFGGLGQNFMNPALGARCFLLIAFAKDMTNFATDTFTGATPLAAMRAGEAVNTMDLLIGTTAGTIGETSVIALVIGAIFMILMGVIDLRIPASYIVSFTAFMLLFSENAFLKLNEASFEEYLTNGSYLMALIQLVSLIDINYLTAQLCAGGLMFGAFFMATDYVTSPITPRGQILFGICCGVFTGIFRCFGANAEGVSFAIILSNLLVPLIEKVTIPNAFGVVKTKAAKGDK